MPKCPTCGKPVEWQDNPARPFCSERCKLIDFGRWADEATLDLLRYLARRPPTAPVLMGLAFRPRQLDPSLVDELTGPVAEDAVRLELGPLTRVDADILLGAGVSMTRLVSPRSVAKAAFRISSFSS